MDVADPGRYDPSLMPPSLRLALLIAPLLVACGTKSQIPTPDIIRDAGQDADAEMDAGTDAELPCFEVPIDGGPINASLDVEAEVGRADIVFLVDVTQSMQEEIDRIRGRLRDLIVPGVREAIPDSQFAVATFADFPVMDYGSRDDRPFTLFLPSSNDITQVQAAVDAIELGDGVDQPESQVEAVYQLATGEGIGAYVPASAGCPMRGIGYACFRRDALPMILLFTDAPMHNGPAGTFLYDATRLGVNAHSYGDALAAVRSIGARVIGFDSGSGAGRGDLTSFARDTNTLDASGRPLVYDIGVTGESLGREVVAAVRTFAGSLVQDVDAIARDPVAGDGVDVLAFIEGVRPLSADPMSGVGAIDSVNGVFRDVEAGTRLTFQITIQAGSVVPGPTAQRFLVEIVFRGNGRTRLASRLIEIVIPGMDGSGCEEN